MELHASDLQEVLRKTKPALKTHLHVDVDTLPRHEEGTSANGGEQSDMVLR